MIFIIIYKFVLMMLLNLLVLMYYLFLLHIVFFVLFLYAHGLYYLFLFGFFTLSRLVKIMLDILVVLFLIILEIVGMGMFVGFMMGMMFISISSMGISINSCIILLLSNLLWISHLQPQLSLRITVQ